MKEKEPVRSYEEAVGELEDILAKLSSDTVTLEESLTLYARAAALLAQCDKTLREASLKMETITQALQQLKTQEEDDDL